MSTATLTKTLTAREYLRVSKDRSGHARSLAEQHADNARATAEHGWKLGPEYRDEDRSASRYATKARESYEKLIADLRADRFDADVLVLWEHSRGSRKVSEWAALVELLEERGVRVHVTSHARTYDPSNVRDRRSLMEDSVDSEYESGKISQRTRRAAAASAAAGRPNGKVPFGYQRRYDERTRKLVAQEPDPATAPLVRELFERVMTGHSLRSIERDWDGRGLRNASGRPFTAQHLRSLLLTRAYVGERVHNPGARDGNKARHAPGMVTAGLWEPLVDRETFGTVQRIITAPERRTTRPGRGVHLLSMIARCAVCNGPLTARSRKGSVEYTCQQGGHVRVSKPELDDLIEDAIKQYLNDEDVRQAHASASDTSAEVLAARQEVEDILGELDELADALGSGSLSPMLAARAEPGIQARLAAARKRVEQLAAPSELDRLYPPGTDWDTMPMPAKREVARTILTPDVLGEVRVLRRPRDAGPRRVPVEERVKWIRSAGLRDDA